jgi:hypothetical protein
VPTTDGGVLRTIAEARDYMLALPHKRAIGQAWQHAAHLKAKTFVTGLGLEPEARPRPADWRGERGRSAGRSLPSQRPHQRAGFKCSSVSRTISCD